MNTAEEDKSFGGSIPEIYDSLLVPLIFESYAGEMITRLAVVGRENILETAAGSGVLSRAIATQIAGCRLVATDLSETMLARAQEIGSSRPVTWKQADAMELPFPENGFDALVCQFGAMFFPDKARAFAEARRVLKAGGLFLFSVWDRIEENEFAATITDALESALKLDSPSFLARTPYAYHDKTRIAADLAAGGFTRPARMETITLTSQAGSAREAAIAFCQGTPLRNEIEKSGHSLSEATDIATRALSNQFGDLRIKGRIQAHIVSVGK